MSRLNQKMNGNTLWSSTLEANGSLLKSVQKVGKVLCPSPRGKTLWKFGVLLQGLCLLLVLGVGPVMAESDHHGKFKRGFGLSEESIDHFKNKTKTKPRPVSLAVTLKGGGMVTSIPKGLSCSQGTCRANFPWGTVIKLKASPENGQLFKGWRGACGGSQKNCTVRLKHPQNVFAKFTPPPPVKLIIGLRGNGTVLSKPEGLRCNRKVCFGRFPVGTAVTLMAYPGEGHAFVGWRGACKGSDLCTLSLNRSQLVGAKFTEHDPPASMMNLTVTKAGTGSGMVTSVPGGIACGGDCTEAYADGATVTLTAAADTGSTFAGWSGGAGSCAGIMTNPCSIPMTAAQAVTATFTPIPPAPVALSVTVLGRGEVVSSPNGLSCPSGTCVVDFPGESMVTLMAIPNPDESFLGWTGACAGTSPCTVTLTAPMVVTATFTPLATGLTDAEAKRFLEQATWGPTPELIAHVKAVGKEGFLNEQFSASPATYPDPDPNSSSLTPVRNQFFHNAFHGQDQLRQRMAFALSQIFVVSANKVGQDYQMIPYLRLLQQGAFGNYEDLMRAVTLSPTMGVYLDMVNNDKTVPGSGLNPNENYPREFLQLFSVGTRLLNSDGSEQVDSSSNPIPPYDQEVILNLSRVMTGWTYPTQPGATPRWRNPSYYDGPMEAVDSHHDIGEKELMNGAILSAGQTAQQDLNQAIQHVFQHPNVGPFVASRLIRHFVTSNPSPQYVARVVQVFDSNSSGVRGDLPSVLKAILLDPEAASVIPPGGHLREPVLFEIALLRALGATVDLNNPLYTRAREMGQDLFSPPSVFNYFSPLYGIPGTALLGPEFQIHNFSSSIARANFVYRVVTGGLGAGASVDLVPFETLAANPNQLVTTIAQLLLHEPLSALEQIIIVSAISPAGATPSTRVRDAVYLIAASSRYQVQH